MPSQQTHARTFSEVLADGGVSILTYVLASESLVALFHGVQQTLHLG